MRTTLPLVLILLAGCQASHTTRPTTAPNDPPAITGGPGTFSAEPAMIVRGEPVKVNGFLIGVDSVSVSMRRSFGVVHDTRAQSPDWSLTVVVAVRSDQSKAWRLGAPLEITTARDDREVDHTADAKPSRERPLETFSPSRYRPSEGWQSLTVQFTPAELPNRFDVFSGVIEVDLVTQTKKVELDPSEPMELELLPGLRAIVTRPAEGGRAQSTVTLIASAEGVPEIRSMMQIGPDGRMRDLSHSGWEVQPDGSRRVTVYVSGPNNTPMPRLVLDVVTAFEPVKLPFEFRGVPVGRVK